VIRLATVADLRDNAPARDFYQSQGWVADGTEKVSDTGPVDVRYELPGLGSA
jgi:hypothetical protein